MNSNEGSGNLFQDKQGEREFQPVNQGILNHPYEDHCVSITCLYIQYWITNSLVKDDRSKVSLVALYQQFRTDFEPMKQLMEISRYVQMKEVFYSML